MIRRQKAEFERSRALVQAHADLMRFAYHDPNKMPDITKSRAKEMSEAKANKLLAAHMAQFFSRHNAFQKANGRH